MVSSLPVEFGQILDAFRLNRRRVRKGRGDLLGERLSSGVRLYPHVDVSSPQECSPLLLPCCRSRRADRKNAVSPRGVAIALTLDENDRLVSARLCEYVETIGVDRQILPLPKRLATPRPKLAT